MNGRMAWRALLIGLAFLTSEVGPFIPRSPGDIAASRCSCVGEMSCCTSGTVCPMHDREGAPSGTSEATIQTCAGGPIRDRSIPPSSGLVALLLSRSALAVPMDVGFIGMVAVLDPSSLYQAPSPPPPERRQTV